MPNKETLEYRERIRKMEWFDFMDTFNGAMMPDDYDGGFTDRGTMEYNECGLELLSRLFALNVLSIGELGELKKLYLRA
jgi:hypothetical protein